MRRWIWSVVLLGLASPDVGADVEGGATPYFTMCGSWSAETRSLVALPDGSMIEDSKRLELLDSESLKRKDKTKRQITGDVLVAGQPRAWCVSEKSLRIGARTVPVIVSAVGEMSGSGSDQFADGITVVARTLSNAEMSRLAAAKKLKQPAALGSESDDAVEKWLRTTLADRAKGGTLWASRNDVVLAGSAPGEIYEGAKARATFKKWNLQLRVDGAMTGGEYGTGLRWVLANVESKPAKGGTPTLYRVFFVLLADHATDESGPPDNDTYHLVVAHFMLVQ